MKEINRNISYPIREETNFRDERQNSYPIYNNIREEINFRDERQNFTNEIYELRVYYLIYN